MKIDLHQITSTYAHQLTASECSQPFKPECDVYKVMGKIYLMTFKLNGIAVINLKVEPVHGEMLRDTYPFIRAGYHMNKQHWISVYEDDALDQDFVQDLILGSYDLVVNKLNKAEQNQLKILKTL